MELSASAAAAQLFDDAVPTYNDTSFGHEVYLTIWSRIEQDTPGSFAGTDNRATFFPNYTERPNQSNLDPSAPWSSWLVAVLTQGIYVATSSVYKKLDHETIWTDVDNHQDTIRAMAVSMFTTLFSLDYRPYTEVLGNLAAGVTSLEVADAYKSLLDSNAYIEGRANLLLDPERNWELFHRWVTLNALGLSVEDINTFITYLTSARPAPTLNVGTEVGAGAWTSWEGWADPGDLGQDQRLDFTQDAIQSEISNGATEEYCSVTFIILPGGYGSEQRQCYEEGYSDHFVDDFASQYIEDSGCCVTGRSTVLLDGDGGAWNMAIEDVSDETLKSPGAGLTTGVLSKPLRGDRTLYSIEGLDFQFTSGHPFVNAERSDPGQPYWLCITPENLTRWAPTFRDAGVGKLSEGSRLSSLTAHPDSEGGAVSYSPSDLTVSGINARESSPATRGELLYGISFQPVAGDSYEYYVGGPEVSRYVLTASELPSVNHYPLATRAIVAILGASVDATNALADRVHRTEFDRSTIDFDEEDGPIEIVKLAQGKMDKTVSHAMLSRRARLMTQAMHRSADGRADAAALEGIDQLVASLMPRFNEGPLAGAKGWNWALGRVYELLIGRHAEEIALAVELGWRVFPSRKASDLEMLAVTVGDLVMSPPYRVDTAQDLEIELSLHCEQGAVSQLVAAASLRPASSYRKHFDHVIYFQEKSLPGSLDSLQYRVEVSLTLPTSSGPMTFSASQYLHHPLPNDHRPHELKFFEDNEEVRGTLSLETRRLTAAQFATEQAQRREWSPADREGFAASFGKAWGQSLADLFTDLEDQAPYPSA